MRKAYGGSLELRQLSELLSIAVPAARSINVGPRNFHSHRFFITRQAVHDVIGRLFVSQTLKDAKNRPKTSIRNWNYHASKKGL